MDEPQYGDIAIGDAANPSKWELWAAPAHPETLYQRFPEFTCRCPRSGYPDFATVHLIVVPDQQVIELKHLKLWFNSFRDRQISHEAATAEVLETLVGAIAPHLLFALMEYTPRGNLTTFPMVEHRSPHLCDLDRADPLACAVANAELVKARLIDRVLAR
jgi:7-cyano-7-deazaguanine reductase